MWQALVALHPPPQVAKPLASLRNCRAETVPAQRTPMTNAEKNVDLIFFMIAFFPCSRPNVKGSSVASYFPGLAAMKLHTPVVNPG